jgi:hypothetical protein
LLRATAASYVISPAAFAAVAPDPARSPDQLSAHRMLALAGRLVRDVGELIAGSTKARKPVATYAIDSEIRFATAADRAAFASELGETVAALAGRYHDGTADGGREHRLVVALHPSITRPPKRSADDAQGVRDHPRGRPARPPRGRLGGRGH